MSVVLFATADGRYLIECPACKHFIFTQRNGAWICTACPLQRR